jgi:hypothetical protein
MKNILFLLFVVALSISLLLGIIYLGEKYENSESVIKERAIERKLNTKKIAGKHETFWAYYIIAEDGTTAKVDLGLYTRANIGGYLYTTLWMY